VDKQDRTTIKINGQQYNALSGRPIGGSIDGIVAQRTTSKIPTSPIKLNSDIKTIQSQTGRSVHNVTKKPLHSATLMRSAVQKPTKSERMISKTNSPIRQDKPNIVVPPVMAGSIDPRLERRAKSFSTNHQISRFGATTKRSNQFSQLSSAVPTPRTTIPQIKPTPKDPTTQLLDRAIQNATSHQQPKLSRKELKQLKGKSPRRLKHLAFTTVGIMFVVVIGFAIHQDMPNLMVKVASARAGFTATLPNYQAVDFKLTSVGYQSNIIELHFEKNNQHQFTLTEHSANWDSLTLVSSVIIPVSGSNYSVDVVNGQSIYLYGQDQAAWTHNGIWYQLKGSNVTDQQIKQIASTL